MVTTGMLHTSQHRLHTTSKATCPTRVISGELSETRSENFFHSPPDFFMETFLPEKVLEIHGFGNFLQLV